EDPVGRGPAARAPETAAEAGEGDGAPDMFLRGRRLGAPGRSLVGGDVAGVVKVVVILGAEPIPVPRMPVFDHGGDTAMGLDEGGGEIRILSEKGEEFRTRDPIALRRLASLYLLDEGREIGHGGAEIVAAQAPPLELRQTDRCLGRGEREEQGPM